MNSIRFCCLVTAISLPATVASAADWPQWNGPKRDGHSADTGLLKTWPKEGPKLVWTFGKTGAGYSSPAVVGSRLYILGADEPDKGDKEFALCIDCSEAKAGKVIWRVPLDNAPGNYTTGYGAGPRSTPAVDGDFLYVLGARGDLRCLKTSDGGKVWGLNLVKDLGGSIPGWGYSESVLIDGGHLVCTPGGKKGTIAKLEKKTGMVVWRSEGVTEAAQYSSIVVGDVGTRQYITLTKGGTIGVRASDGKLLWNSKKAGANAIAVCPTAILNGKYVFASSGYGSGCGLLELTPDGTDNVKMKEVYLNKKIMVNHHGGMVRVGDFIYGYNDKNGSWVCLDYLKYNEDTEEPAWKSKKLDKEKDKSLDKGSIAYADGHLYLYGQGKGVCALIEANPKEWKETGRLELPAKSKLPRRSGGIWTHPVIANGKLFLRDQELLFCFEIKQ